MKFWTPEDDVRLRAVFADNSLTMEARGTALGVSSHSARDRAKRIGVVAPPRSRLGGVGHTGTPFTAEQDAELTSLASQPENSYAVIAKLMGMSRNAIIGRAHRLGIRRGPALTGLCAAKALANSKWTAARVARLVSLAGGELTARQVSEAMNGEVSRQAVTEKARRMGLILGRHIPVPPQRAKATKRVEERSLRPTLICVVPGPRAPLRPEAHIAPAGLPRLRDLGLCSCRWPIGAVLRGHGEDQRFCGAELADDFRVVPYCAEHAISARKAAQPSSKVEPYEAKVIFNRPLREAA